MTAITGESGAKLRAALIIALGVMGVVASLSGAAQNSRAGGGIKRLFDPQYPELELAPEESPPLKQVLPDVPAEPVEPSVSSKRVIFVQAIEVKGNTLLPERTIRDIITPYEEEGEISAAQLHQLRFELSQAYYDAGYINSGVIIPDQKVKDGRISLLVIEGVLSKVELVGNERLRDSYIIGRLAPGVGEILNENTTRLSLRLLQLDPLIEQINAQLLPGDAPGEAVLHLKLKESKPYTLSIAADNYRSPSVGAEHAYLYGVHRNLTGQGDRLYGEIGVTDGLDEIELGYQFSATSDTTLGITYRRTDSKVVESPFDEIDVESETDSVGMYLSHLLSRDLNSEFSGLVGFDVRHAESQLLGEPFSFSPGVEDGESDVSVLWGGLEWTQRGSSHALALRGTFRQGIDVLDATDNDTNTDGTFSLVLMQFQYLQRLDYFGMQLMARSTVQYSLDPLLPIEKFGVGGRYSVRGYRENQFVRDNGAVATLEGRIPLFQDRNNRSRYSVALASFVDYGRTWDKDNDLPTAHSTNISSIGVSLIWEAYDSLSAELSWGYAFDDVDSPDDDLQDDGIHFSIQYRIM